MPLPALIPRRALFCLPARLAPALSPSGRRLAYLSDRDGAFNIWVATPGVGDDRPVTGDPRGILGFRWMYDDRHLVYPCDRDGGERTQLKIVDLATGRTRTLTPDDADPSTIVGLEPAVPDRLLIEVRRPDGRREAFRIDVRTGERELAADDHGVLSWIADSGLRVRAATTRAADGSAAVVVREDENACWRTLYSVGSDDAATLRAISFTADDSALLVVSSRDAAATRLLRIAVADGSAEVVYQDPAGYDVTEVALDPITRTPRLAFVLRARRDLEVLDPAIAGDVARLRQRCVGDLSLIDTDRTDRRWIVGENRDDRPFAYHHYDRVTGEVTRLFTHLPSVESYRLARTEPFSFSARDGLVVHGYLTFPPGVPPRSLPAVLTVHGGPWFRTGWGFRAEPQWLANRGYLCIDVDYRGSAGYGREFRNAGDREWGGRMQDDLIDAVRFLTGRGMIAADRIGVYGSSYGGYAALVAAAFTPELFRCAIAVAGPSDLRTFVASAGDPPHPVATELRRRVGDPVSDAEFLWSRSPLSRVDRIRIPLLIVHGGNDPRVRREESEQIVAALEANGVEHQFLLFEDEGHGLIRADNRMAFYAAAERFLAEHLGGRQEAATASLAEVRT